VQEARCMCLIPWTLRSGSEQLIYNRSWKKLKKKNLDLDQGNWRQHNGTDKRTPEQRYIYRERIYKSCKGNTQKKVMLKYAESHVKAIRKRKVVPEHAESHVKATRKRKSCQITQKVVSRRYANGSRAKSCRKSCQGDPQVEGMSK
jgi:hypothetical protein